MNILYIHTHDTGRYVSPYGHKMPTPNLQKFAEGGTLFRQAFTTAPTCSPSRAAMMTGRSAHQSGMLGLAHRGFALSDPARHLPAFLRRHGYDAFLCGIEHEFGSATGTLHQAYTEMISANFSGHFQWDQDNANNVAKFLLSRNKSDAPFFLSFGLFSTHREFVDADPAEFDPDYIMPPSPIPDTPGTRQDMANYAATVKITDDCVGKVLDALRASHCADDTIVVFSTDHGLPLPGMKCSLTDAGTGISLIMDWPGNPAKGKVMDAMVSHLDLFPTFCALAGIAPPDDLQGKSLLPLMNGETDTLHDEIFGEVTFHAAYEPKRSIRTNRYKLIKLFDDDSRRPVANCDNSPARRLLLEAGWQNRLRPRVRVYDLILDPNEQDNLAGRLEFSEVQDDLEIRLHDWMMRTEDPLLHGRVPRPQGSIVCTRDALDTDAPLEPADDPGDFSSALVEAADFHH